MDWRPPTVAIGALAAVAAVAFVFRPRQAAYAPPGGDQAARDAITRAQLGQGLLGLQAARETGKYAVQVESLRASAAKYQADAVVEAATRQARAGVSSATKQAKGQTTSALIGIFGKLLGG